MENATDGPEHYRPPLWDHLRQVADPRSRLVVPVGDASQADRCIESLASSSGAPLLIQNHSGAPRLADIMSTFWFSFVLTSVSVSLADRVIVWSVPLVAVVVGAAIVWRLGWR